MDFLFKVDILSFRVKWLGDMLAEHNACLVDFT